MRPWLVVLAGWICGLVVISACSLAAAELRGEVSPPPPVDFSAVAPPGPTSRPWPLSELPSLQPHLDLAMARDACTPEAAARAKSDDVRAYLAAWCRIRAGEREAVDQLAPLARSAQKDVARAALLDVINLIADYDGHQAAVAHLQRLRLLTTPNLDLLAATYLALGMHDDAFSVGRQTQHDQANPADTAHCERQLAWSTLDEHGGAPAIPTGHHTRDACDRIRATACAMTRAGETRSSVGARMVAMNECFLELPADPERDAKLAVMIAYASWGTAINADDWLAIERVAENGLEIPGGEGLAVSALEAVSRMKCGDGLGPKIVEATRRLVAADHHDGAYDRRLAAVANAAKTCR